MLEATVAWAAMLGIAQPVLAERGLWRNPGFVEYLTKELKSMRIQGGGTLGNYLAAGAKLEFSTIYQEERKVVCSLKFNVLFRGQHQKIRSRVTYMLIADDRAT